jgi:hypothetical protein
VIIKESAASKKIIVKNVAWGATDLELKKLLSEAGEVISFQGMKDNEGKDRGHRIIEYKTRSEANKAKKTLNNRELKGRPMHIMEFKDDTRKESIEFVTKVIGEAMGPTRPTILRGTPSSVNSSSRRDPPSPPPPPAPDQSGPTMKLGPRKSNAKFRRTLIGKGMKYVVVKGDGFCLFHAVAERLGRSEEGQRIKAEVLSELNRDPDRYSRLLLKNEKDEDGSVWQQHLRKIENEGWGVEPEVAAIQALYGRKISIWYPGENGVPTQDQEYNSDEKDAINLAYYPNRHYNALLPSIITADTIMEVEIKEVTEGVPSLEEGIPLNVNQESQSI